MIHTTSRRKRRAQGYDPCCDSGTLWTRGLSVFMGVAEFLRSSSETSGSAPGSVVPPRRSHPEQPVPHPPVECLRGQTSSAIAPPTMSSTITVCTASDTVYQLPASWRILLYHPHLGTGCRVLVRSSRDRHRHVRTEFSFALSQEVIFLAAVVAVRYDQRPLLSFFNAFNCGDSQWGVCRGSLSG